MRAEDVKLTQKDWLALLEKSMAEAAEGITIADARLPNRPLIYVNEGFERLTGYSASEALGRNCKFLQGPNANPETVEIISKALHDGVDCVVEILNHRKDGTPFWNRLSLTPLCDESGAVNYFIGIQSDVTGRRQAEEGLRRANKKMRKDLEDAAAIQQAWLPQSLPNVPGYRLEWLFRPCQELAGDNLKIVHLDDDHVGLFILDVCGHGVPAALLSVSLNRWLAPTPGQSFLFVPDPGSPTGHRPATPAAVAQALNRHFSAGPKTGKFFTILYGVLQLSSGKFRYITAGHPPPVRIRPDGASLCPLAKGLPMGVLPDFIFEEETITLDSGDRLLLYTDGAFEAFDGNEMEIGEERLFEELASLYHLPPDQSLAEIVRSIEAWCPGDQPQDDITLLSVDRLARDV